ncbi:hypothetical protein VKT23_005698 [Stygiomarasmius scandens]
MITQCCIHELYLQQKSNQTAVELAKTFERRKCNHREAIQGDECLKHVVGDTNKHRYVVATQNQPLRVKLRSIPAVPLVHINRSVMVLEPPSDATIRAKNATEEQSLHSTSSDKVVVQSLAAAPQDPPKKKKGPKGPNPLSIKKKKHVQSEPKVLQSKDPKKMEEHKSPSNLKRRRVEDDAVSEEGSEQGQDEARGRKRKRRRRTKLSQEFTQERSSTLV